MVGYAGALSLGIYGWLVGREVRIMGSSIEPFRQDGETLDEVVLAFTSIPYLGPIWAAASWAGGVRLVAATSI